MAPTTEDAASSVCPRWSRPPLKCVGCGKEGCDASQLLLDDGVIAHWVDCTWALCFKCSEFNDVVKFNITAMTRWDQRDYTMWPEGLRISQFRKTIMVLEQRIPGASQWQLRILTHKRREAAAMAMATALDQESEECCRAARRVAEQYFEAIRAAIANPSYRACCDGISIKNTEAAFLTEVAKGVTFSFRFACTGCGFTAMQEHWIKRGDRHFRCPTCNKFHDPSIGIFQHMISMTDPCFGVIFSCPGMWPDRINNKRVGLEDNGWLNLMVQSKARNIQIGEDLDSFVQKSVISLSDLLATLAIPSGFESLGCKQEVKMFRNWPELIGLLANVLAGAKALGSVIL